ncbi:hypothetical protein Hanom_Chr05g00427211 [Helianthus anomalus]
MNKAVRVARVIWSLVNRVPEMMESHGLERDLNRRMDFTGSLEKISSIISSGYDSLAFCSNLSSDCSCCCSRAFMLGG